MSQGFKQSSGVTQGGEPWYDPNAGIYVEAYKDPDVDEYAKILHQVPISLMIKILKRFGYKVVSPDENEK